MTKGYVPSSKPSDVKQDSKEQFETIGTSFQPKLNPFKSPIEMHADWCVKIFLKIASNLTNILSKTKQW